MTPLVPDPNEENLMIILYPPSAAAWRFFVLPLMLAGVLLLIALGTSPAASLAIIAGTGVIAAEVAARLLGLRLSVVSAT